jgi:DNA (cytosine-5)-methyltransferase 3A
MIKLYIGGSPCTRWSIAQTKNRETEPSGLGWELFENYVIGLRKYKPDYFLYENNKSMAPAIREQITKELGVEPILINSSLVAAQNRNRLYWSNIPGITQPEDKGILLIDILETGMAWREKSYTLDANYYRTAGTYDPTSQHSYSRHMAAEPVYPFGTNPEGKAHCLDANYWKGSLPEGTLEKHRRSLVAVPCMKVPEATKIGFTEIEPMDCVDLAMATSKTRRGRNMKDKSNCLTTSPDFYQYLGTVNKPIYEVKEGHITIKDKQYPIKLQDGYYIIRKLTVLECMRLQTVPEWYIFPVSDSQAYKMLGNGWTVDVIAHQLSFIPGILTDEIEVLSMYDGMSCGHIALDVLGANVIRYYATEIDRYAIQTAKHNYPDMIHLGDAYQVRNEEWLIH